MLNYIWAAMIILGVIIGAFSGRLADVTTAALEGGKEAVGVCITMLGIIGMWTGIMKIAEKSGLVEILSGKLNGLLHFLFPRIPNGHPAKKYISINIIANILGLGWAATPAGLAAMTELQKLNHHKDRASREMCVFMIFNMSSLQLITVSILAYRTQYGSVSPAEVIAPGLIATIISTIAGVIAAKILERRYRD